MSASELPGTYPPFDKGLDLNIFIKNNSDQPFIGKVWNKASTVWPDFTNPNITSYWIEMLTILHRNVPYDGLWIVSCMIFKQLLYNTHCTMYI